jgi:hypothetical protein
VKLNRDEHNDIQWLSGKDLEDPRWGLSKPLKYYAHEALKKVR